MNIALAYITGLGPYFIVAFALGATLAAMSPWLWSRPERWLFFALLFLSLLVLIGDGDSSEGSSFRQVTWGGLFAFCALKLAQLWKELPSASHLLPPWLIALLLFALISCAWSPVPFVSIRRFAQVVGVLLIAILVAHRAVKGRGLLDQIAWASASIVLLGLLFSAALPSRAFDLDGALRAFSSHKNTWGQVSLISSLAFLVLMVTRRRSRALHAAILLVSASSLVASQSSTSIVAFGILGLLVVTWLSISRWGVIGKIALILACGASAVAAHVYIVLTGELPTEALSDALFSATGKNETLSGRVFLWKLMFIEIMRHPWLGIGYGGFWTGPDGASAFISASVNWGPPSQAHSGYIDVLNELGIVGLLLLLAVMISHASGIVRAYRLGLSDAALFHGGVLLCVAVVNYAETTHLRTTHLWWILFCASVVEIHLVVKRVRAGTNMGSKRRSAQRMSAMDGVTVGQQAIT